MAVKKDEESAKLMLEVYRHRAIRKDGIKRVHDGLRLWVLRIRMFGVYRGLCALGLGMGSPADGTFVSISVSVKHGQLERASELSIQGRVGILRLGQKGFTDKGSEATKPGLPPKPKVPPSGLHELYGSCEQVGLGTRFSSTLKLSKFECWTSLTQDSPH